MLHSGLLKLVVQTQVEETDVDVNDSVDALKLRLQVTVVLHLILQPKQAPCC